MHKARYVVRVTTIYNMPTEIQKRLLAFSEDSEIKRGELFQNAGTYSVYVGSTRDGGNPIGELFDHGTDLCSIYDGWSHTGNPNYVRFSLSQVVEKSRFGITGSFEI